MKAIDRPFTKIINGTTQFKIPVFQRDYNWTEGHCEQLWRDVVRIAAEPGDRGHFLGSFVYISTGDSSAGFTRWLLIDGQQRLTTLTLLLTALRDHIQDTAWEASEGGPTPKKLEAYFLKNVQEEGERLHKLVLRRHDQASLGALLDRSDEPAEASERIRENYEFFREQLRDADPELVYRGIGRLVVVDVTLDRRTDDPQLIFESLNSTGLDLSQSDLIRNFILMRLPEPEQTRLYEAYWSKIEGLFRGSEKVFDAFVRDYIALRTQASKQEKADELYFAFRRELGSIGNAPARLEQLLQELLRYARYHAAFSIGRDAPDALRVPLERLRRLVDVPGVLIMRLYECHDMHGTLTLTEFSRALELIESYVFRRAICSEQTRAYWQTFANLAYRIEEERPLESLETALALVTASYAFPSDEVFRAALEERDIYHKRVCFGLLDRLENHGSKEPTDTSRYTIEHIMPQNERLSADWRRMLGEGWQEVQREWLHRLGNLTLTGYNSTYSDRPFAEKKGMPGGFEESAVRLNKYVRERSSWTALEMRERGEALAERALQIWPALIVDEAQIARAKEAEMRQRAKRRDVANVPMSPAAKALFDLLRQKLGAAIPDVIEMAESRSVSYHGPSFFLEVLPRKRRLILLLPLDFNEVADGNGIAKDASERQFIVNAVYEGGVLLRVNSSEDVDAALPIVHQAREVANS